jgi:hypothetical protein
MAARARLAPAIEEDVQQLVAGRASAETMRANQFRMYLSAC